MSILSSNARWSMRAHLMRQGSGHAASQLPLAVVLIHVADTRSYTRSAMSWNKLRGTGKRFSHDEERQALDLPYRSHHGRSYIPHPKRTSRPDIPHAASSIHSGQSWCKWPHFRHVSHFRHGTEPSPQLGYYARWKAHHENQMNTAPAQDPLQHSARGIRSFHRQARFSLDKHYHAWRNGMYHSNWSSSFKEALWQTAKIRMRHCMHPWKFKHRHPRSVLPVPFSPILFVTLLAAYARMLAEYFGISEIEVAGVKFMRLLIGSFFDEIFDGIISALLNKFI